MNEREKGVDRREFFKTAGAGITAAGIMMTPRERALAQALDEKGRFDRIAACSYPIRYIFKNRAGGNRGGGAGAGAGRGGATGQPAPGPDQPPDRGATAPAAAAGGAATAPSAAAQPLPPRAPVNGGWSVAQMKEKYGEITMLDFPQFTKDTFPGVTHMDIFSGLFGDVTDDSMFAGRTFDPMSPSGRKWLDQLANKLVTTGTKVQHISNNAPTNLAGPDEAERKAGVDIAKRWLEGCAVLGVKSMRMNSPQALGPSIRPNAIPRSNDGYPRNLDIIPLLNAAIESYKEMADYGGNLGIKVTFENHWGLAADPMNIRIMLDTINHPYCEASPRTRIARRHEELEGCVRDLEKVRGALTAALPQVDARAPIELATRLGEIATELSDVLSSLARTASGSTEDAEALARTSATLQEQLRRVRMMTVGRLFARLLQPVRELARKQHKEIVVVTSGEETEIDKSVVERVAEPLVHLVRNAVAHGIEPPDVRRAAGKPPAGTLTLSARHDGDVTEIVVADDGLGIDLDAVRRALVAQRRASPDEAARLDDQALYATLFEPGVSTRLDADDLAGRGVGLDAVKDAITRLGGQVRVRSTPGVGAAFVVRLPLTTAVQQALLFKVGGQVYAVPAARVEEAAQVTLADVRVHEDREWVLVRGRELPLVRLGALLGVPAPPGLVKRAALVLTLENEQFALTCDKVIGPREIVVRSLGPLLASLPLYAGATISGAGKVQLILDVARLAEFARHGVRGARPTRALGPRRVLVVDDSRSIRETASLILLQGGYAVESVPDGWDAWEMLQDRPFDLLLTDLEMPRLDGHELITKVRRTDELKRLPIVVISSRTAETTRARVLGEGADGFVAKPLRRRVLLEAVEAVLQRPAT